MPGTETRTIEMDGDLRARVVALENQATSHSQRMLSVENWQRQADITNAHREEQFVGMNDRFGRIEVDLQKINGTLAKIMWLIIGGILSGIVAFMIRGGFSP